MADPGFPVGGRGSVRGRGPPMQVLSPKMCAKMKELGVRRARPLDPPMSITFISSRLSKASFYYCMKTLVRSGNLTFAVEQI